MNQRGANQIATLSVTGIMRKSHEVKFKQKVMFVQKFYSAGTKRHRCNKNMEYNTEAFMFHVWFVIYFFAVNLFIHYICSSDVHKEQNALLFYFYYLALK